MVSVKEILCKGNIVLTVEQDFDFKKYEGILSSKNETHYGILKEIYKERNTYRKQM